MTLPRHGLAIISKGVEEKKKNTKNKKQLDPNSMQNKFSAFLERFHTTDN